MTGTAHPYRQGSVVSQWDTTQEEALGLPVVCLWTRMRGAGERIALLVQPVRHGKATVKHRQSNCEALAKQGNALVSALLY